LLISLPAVVMCLARWTASSKEVGGLQTAEDRASCRATLLSLLSAIDSSQGLQLCVLPAASPAGRTWVAAPSLKLRCGVGLVAWLKDQDLECSSWLLEHQADLPAIFASDRFHVADLLTALASHRRFRLVLAAVCAPVSYVLQDNLLQPAAIGAAVSPTASSSAASGPQVHFRLGKEVMTFGAQASEWISDQLLVSYWSAGKEATEGCTQLSVATDKGRIGGRAKFNNAILLPNNMAFWAVPQVAGVNPDPLTPCKYRPSGVQTTKNTAYFRENMAYNRVCTAYFLVCTA